MIEVTPRAAQNTTYPVSVQLKPIDGVSLVEGMDGEVTLRIPNPNGGTPTVPASAVVGALGGERYLWVAEAKGSGPLGTVRKQSVVVGQLREKGHLEILEGVTAGMLVVARGAPQLEAGVEVSMELATME